MCVPNVCATHVQRMYMCAIQLLDEQIGVVYKIDC